jgi:hypothetical protein
MNQRTEAKEFARAVIQMVAESDMHKSLVWAELLSEVADKMVDNHCDDHIDMVRKFAEGIRRRAIVT